MGCLWGWIWFVARESLVQKQKVESIWWLRLGQEKELSWQSWLKPWRIKFSPLIYHGDHISKCEVHCIKFLGMVSNCMFPIFVTLVCHPICSVLGICVSNWNCEAVSIKCCVMLSPLKKTELVWLKLSIHFSAWSLSTQELIWDYGIQLKEFAELELHRVCNIVKAYEL